jgi:hypothetical protein
VTLDGANAFSRLTDDSELWPLVPGNNVVIMSMASATSVTAITFGWRNRWLAA